MRNNFILQCMLAIMTLMLSSTGYASASEQPAMAYPLENQITDSGYQSSLDQDAVSPSIPFAVMAESIDQMTAR
jgi:hypothetical protein